MATAETIKEYLVGLGFKVDETSFKKFASVLGGTGGSIVKFAGVLATAAAASTVFVDKVTKRLDNLYWVTQRLYSSVSNIKSYELAIEKMGGTAEGALASLEGVAAMIRTNPATESFIHMLGVETRNSDGSMRDMVLTMRDLGERFRQMPYWLAAKWAERLGIDEKTLYAMTRGLSKFGDQYGEVYKRLGLDPKRAAESAHLFQNRLRDLHAEIDATAMAVAINLLPVADQVIAWFRGVAEWAVKASRPTGELTRFFKDFGKIVSDIEPLVSGIGKIGAAAAHLLAGQPPEALEFGIIGYFLLGKKGALLLGSLGALSALIDKVAGDKSEVNKNNLNKYGKDGWYAAARWLNDNGLGYLNTNEFNATYGAYKNGMRGGATPAPSGPAGRPNDPLGIRNNNPANLRSWGSAPISGGFARFGSAVQGISAAAGNLLAYGRRGWDTVREIISHWAPSSENNTGAYIKDVMRRTGFGADTQLDLRNPAVLQRLINAIISHENGFNPYSSALVAAGVNARLTGSRGMQRGDRSGGRNVTIQQKTDIHVHSTGDARQTGKEVAGEQSRVNGDLVRNTKTAVL